MPGSFHIPRPQSAAQVEALFAAQRSADPIGVRIHLALALGACFFAGWSTSYVEWCAVPVLLCFLVRMTGRHRILEPLAFDRVLHLLLAWGAWVGLSVLWSSGPNFKAWQVDIQPLRFLALAVILWPVMDHRRWLILTLMAGIACGQCAQLIHLTTLQLGSSWMPFHRMPGRITGWWDPVSGGTVLCAGLGLWLAPALFGIGRWRIFGALGVAVTLVCIGLTGTRGAWIGAAGLCTLSIAIALYKVRPRSRILIPVVAIFILALLGGGAAYLAAGPRISDRLHRGVEEVRAAFDSKDYTTDTGLRIAMWQWAAAAAKERPIVGVGAGGYQPWVRSQTPETAAALHAPIEAAPEVHAQAHSWYLHTLATTGLVGLTLLGLLSWSALKSGLAAHPGPSDLLHSLSMGPALALIGLACAGLFDTITVNQQPDFLFYLLIALCLPSRPRPAGARP